MPLFYSSAIRGVISTTLFNKLHFRLHEMKRRAIIVDNKEDVVVDEMSQVPVAVGPGTTKLFCFILSFPNMH